MHYGLTPKPSLTTNECLVLGVHSDSDLPDFAQTIDKAHQGIISKLITRATDAGDMAWQIDIEGHSLVVVQCGKKEEFTAVALQKRVADITDSLIKQRFNTATLCLPQIAQQTPEWQL